REPGDGPGRRPCETGPARQAGPTGRAGCASGRGFSSAMEAFMRLTRRFRDRAVLLFVGLCLLDPRGSLAAPPDSPAAADARPNILLCIADDWSWPHAGAYGDTVVKTPTFDRVAAEGVLFTRAFCAAPSCSP